MLAAVGVGGLAAVARAHGAPGEAGATLADGVRRLRAAVVGDVRDPSSARREVDAGDPGATRGLSWAAQRALAAVRRHRPPTVVGSALPWWADTAHWGPGVVFWNERTAPALVAEAGDTVTLPIPDLPAALPPALRARGVHWQADGAVTFLGEGRAVLDAPGAAEITAITPAGRTRTPVSVRPVVRGRVYAGDDGAPVAARIVVRRGAGVDTAWTDAAGRFRLALGAALGAALGVDDRAGDAGSVEVRVEPLVATHAPVVLPALPVAALHTLGVVLLPTAWTITAGSYAGASVPVRASSARGFWQFTTGTGRGVAWLHDAPHTVAFAPGFDEADTATFWRAARELGEAWGRPLFVAGAADSVADVVVRPAPGLHEDGLTTLGWDGSGAVSGVTVELRVRRPGALQAQVVAHELLHALGFGHARGWPSVLAPAGRPNVGRATVGDVAYGQLAESLRRQTARAEADYGAAYGWPDRAR